VSRGAAMVISSRIEIIVRSYRYPPEFVDTLPSVARSCRLIRHLVDRAGRPPRVMRRQCAFQILRMPRPTGGSRARVRCAQWTDEAIFRC
jgi:hypothetical protein